MIIFNSSMTHQCRFPGFFDHIKMTSNNKSSHRCAQNMLYMKTHLLKEHIYFIGYNYTYYQKRPPIHVNTYQCSFNVCQEWRVWSKKNCQIVWYKYLGDCTVWINKVHTSEGFFYLFPSSFLSRRIGQFSTIIGLANYLAFFLIHNNI